MDNTSNLELEEAARYIEVHSEFTFEDALESLRKSLKYFIPRF